MTHVFDTATVPDGGRVDRWSKAVGQALVPMTVTPYAPYDDRPAGARGGTGTRPFHGRVTTERIGHLRISTLVASPQRITRTQRHITQDAGRTERHVVVGTADRAEGSLRQNGRTARLGPRTLLLWDTGHPYVLDHPEALRLRTVLVPRRTLGVPDRHLEEVVAVAIERDDPVAAVVAPILDELSAAAAACPEPVAPRLARNVSDLLATLVAGRAHVGPRDTERTRHTLLQEVRAHVDRHLGDPGLSPESIAAAHHMSVRSLHQLFRSEGVTVSRWIQRRRLEECGWELSFAGPTAPTVAAVAQRWGFASPAHFSRLFRATYGMSPSTWRATRSTGTPTAPAPAPAPARNAPSGDLVPMLRAPEPR